MIVLYNNQTNAVVLTLNESARLTNPFYLFEFKSDFNPEQPIFYFGSPNLSTNVCRYDLFNIIVSDTEGSTTSVYDLPIDIPQGQYTYNVYEATVPTLNVADTTGRVLETGRLMLIDTTTNTTLNNNPDTNSIYI